MSRQIGDRQKPHNWRPGIIQSCGNAGCSWKRTNRINATGEATSRMLYAWGERNFAPMKYVPPCGSKPRQETT